MKRILTIILFFVLFAFFATACYTTYKCPAYSQNQEIETCKTGNI